MKALNKPNKPESNYISNIEIPKFNSFGNNVRARRFVRVQYTTEYL